jgi:hypothetical protein
MANTEIRIKHSVTSGNTPSVLANGEIAINSADGKLFYSTPAGQIQSIEKFLGPAGLNTEIQFNDNGVLGASSNLSFNKTTGELVANSVKSNSHYDIKNEVRQASATLITTNTAPSVLTSFSTSSYATGKIVIQATSGSNRQATELLITHDGTTAYAVEYAIIKTNASLFTVDVDIVSTNVRLLVTSATSNSTTYKALVSLISS